MLRAIGRAYREAFSGLSRPVWLLAVATRHAWLSGHHLTVRNPGPAVRRMAHLTRLAHAIEVERVAATA